LKRLIRALIFLAGVAAVIAPSAATACGYAAGTVVEVKWKGVLYQAAIISCDGPKNGCLIHYAGWDQKWDEQAKCDRIRVLPKARFEAGDAALIAWKSSWFPGSVKSVDGDRYCITYEGYDATWDECVRRWRLKPHPEPSLDLGPASIRLRVKDLARSRGFYAKLGFEVMGDQGEKGLLMARAGVVIALLTGEHVGSALAFRAPNVRAVEKQLTARGVDHEVVADDKGMRSRRLIVIDPDGHRILIDRRGPPQ